MLASFNVNDMTIHRIVEKEYAFAPVLAFLPGLSQSQLEESRSWTQAAALDPHDKLVICFQSYVVKTPRHTVLIDTCIGNDKIRPVREAWNRKSDDHYMRALATADVSVDNIDFVMCTRPHVDDVRWNTRLQNGRWVPTFPNARYVFSGKECDYWAEERAKNRIRDGDQDISIADIVLLIVAADQIHLFGLVHALDDQVRLLPTPGHTIDHFAVCFGRGSDAAVVTDDLLHTPLDLRKDINFNSKITQPIFDESERAWSLQTESGETIVSRFCVLSVGCLSLPRVPDFPGLERFHGAVYHTGNWPHEIVDFTGLKVGVIGTGSSGIQVIPEIAVQAEHLHVFQRTANFSFPAKDSKVDEEANAPAKAEYCDLRKRAKVSRYGIASYPVSTTSALEVSEEKRQAAYEQGWNRGSTSFTRLYKDILTDPVANATAAEFVCSKIRAIVNLPTSGATTFRRGSESLRDRNTSCSRRNCRRCVAARSCVGYSATSPKGAPPETRRRSPIRRSFTSFKSARKSSYPGERLFNGTET